MKNVDNNILIERIARKKETPFSAVLAHSAHSLFLFFFMTTYILFFDFTLLLLWAESRHVALLAALVADYGSARGPWRGGLRSLRGRRRRELVLLLLLAVKGARRRRAAPLSAVSAVAVIAPATSSSTRRMRPLPMILGIPIPASFGRRSRTPVVGSLRLPDALDRALDLALLSRQSVVLEVGNNLPAVFVGYR